MTAPILTAKVVLSKLSPLYPYLILVLLVIVAGLGASTMFLSFKVMGLQQDVIDAKLQDINLTIKASEISNEVGTNYVTEKTTKEVEYVQVKGDTQTIIKENTVYRNVCIDGAGVQKYNEFIRSSDAGESSSAVP